MADDTGDDPQIFQNLETGEYVDADGNPIDVEEVDERTSRFGFFRKDESAELKRQLDKERRAKERLLRDRGDAARRRKWLVWGVIAVLAITLLGTFKSCSAVTKSDVESMVDERLQAQGSDFPVGQAVMWAGQVITTWGNWDAEREKARQTLLAPFLSQGMQPQAGWNEQGKQQVLSLSVNPEPLVLNANRAIVDTAIMIDDGTWRCYALPVFATKPKSFSTTARFAFTLTGNPVPIGCNPTVGAPALTKKNSRNDQNAAAQLKDKFFPGFFAAWAASDQATLGQFLDDGVRTVGLAGAFRSDPKPVIDNVVVPIEGKSDTVGDVTTATVTVTWTTANGKSALTSTYNVPMHKSGGQWFVSGEPAPAAQDPDVNGRAASNNGDSGSGSSNGDDPNNPNNGSQVYPTPQQTPPSSDPEYKPGSISDSSTPAAP